MGEFLQFEEDCAKAGVPSENSDLVFLHALKVIVLSMIQVARLADELRCAEEDVEALLLSNERQLSAHHQHSHSMEDVSRRLRS